MVNTNESLLQRIKHMDAHQAWQEFYDCYWASILRYTTKLGLSHSQGRDVLQETMVALMRILPNFEYNPKRGRFRNFLLTIVHRLSLNVMHRQRRHPHDTWEESVHGTIRAADPAHTILEKSDLERWRQSVAQEALHELQNDPTLDARTWVVFEAYALKGQSVREVARHFGLKPNAIYQIKNRLLTRLHKRTTQRLRDCGMDTKYSE